MATVMYPKQITRRAWERLNPDHTIWRSTPKMLRQSTEGLEVVPVLIVERDQLFPLGQLVATQTAIDASYRLGGPGLLSQLIQRHHAGDWGQMDRHDLHANDQAVVTGERIFCSYTIEGLSFGLTFWVITEADRAVTTALLPSDY